MVGFFIRFTIIYLVIKGENDLSVYAAREDQVKFYHYITKDSFEQVSLTNFESLKKDAPMYIVIDGFLSNLKTSMSQTVKDGLLKSRPNGNVIVADWSRLSGAESLQLQENTKFEQLMIVYKIAKSRVEFVGDNIATLLEQLVLQNATSYSKVHVIGYSLGAHIAGVAGKNIIDKYNGRITRITGLDPAGPGFPLEKPSKRLDKSDSEFVDVYYSNRYTAGDMEHNVGHVDVYINGGRKQPGCDSPGLISTTICNHAFSWRVWDKCMNEKCKACPCYSPECLDCSGSCTNGFIVGMDISLDLNGDYYLKVDPFPN